ncbi:glycosyl transferase family 1, partial [Methylobacterium radiotolerans]
GAAAARLARAAPMDLGAHTAALRGLYACLIESAAGAMQHPAALALE